MSAKAGGPPAGPCSVPECAPSTDDSAWRVVAVPHDSVVEGNFSQYEDASAGFLPPVSAWYRKHLAVPAAWATCTVWLDLDGVMQNSSVYLNGALLGYHSSGFTAARYFISDGTAIKFGVGLCHDAAW